MKISTKGRYGVRIMLELALYYNQSLLTVRSISQKQNISEKYIEQIISMLNKAGLVRSQRGASGGYCLAEPPDRISIGQILHVTEGNINIVKCTGVTAEQCERKEDCVTSEVWIQVRNAVDHVIDNITLGNLVHRYHEKCNYNCVI